MKGRKPLGATAIIHQVEKMKPLSVKLFPAETYPSPESVRARCGELMRHSPRYFVTSKEAEGIYVIRLRDKVRP